MTEAVNVAGEFSMLFQLAGVGVVQTDLTTGRIVRANKTFCDITGYSQVELGGMTYQDLTHPDDRERDAASFGALQRGEIQGGSSLTRCLRKDGEVVWLELHVTVVEGEGGERLNLTVASNVTERKRREANREFLVEISEDLGRLSAEEKIIQTVGAKLAAHLGLACYHYVDIDEERAEVTVRHFWHAEDVPSTLGTFPIQGFTTPDGLNRARAGETNIIYDVQRDVPGDDAATAALKAGAAAQKIGAYVVVPYSQDGRWRAYFAAADSSPRRWTRPEVELIQEVANRISPRIERVRVETALRESEKRQAFMLELGDAMRAQSGADAIIEVAARQLGEHLNASRVLFAEFDEARGTADIFNGWFADGAKPFPAVMQLEEYEGPILNDLRAGRTVRIDDTGERPSERPDLAAIAEVGVKALLSVPLLVGKRLLVNLSVHQHEARGWTDDDVSLVQEVAERLWADLGRARAEAALRELNETLEQRVEERTEELRRSQMRFIQAFRAGPMATCITTLDQDARKETFLEVNEAFTQLTGYPTEEAVGRTAQDLGMWVSPEDQRKLAVVSTGEVGFRNLELHLRTKAGDTKTVLLSGEVIRLDGHHGFLKLFYDITEQRRSEEELYRAIQEVMSDTAWFSKQVLERLAHIRSGHPEAKPSVELTQRERQVLSLLAQGKSNEAIAAELRLAQQTVRNYISIVYDKLEVNSRVEAVVWARERGIT